MIYGIVAYARAKPAESGRTQALTRLACRNQNWTVAQKEPSKLKEISYIHPVGYLATQVKQGPAAFSTIAEYPIATPLFRYFRPFRSSYASNQPRSLAEPVKQVQNRLRDKLLAKTGGS